MAKYLFRANYTLDGLRGLRREGGTPRKAVRMTLKSASPCGPSYSSGSIAS